MNIFSIFMHKLTQNMNKIGCRIKRFREEKGITQDLMAYELDISQSNYSRLEKK